MKYTVTSGHSQSTLSGGWMGNKADVRDCLAESKKVTIQRGMTQSCTKLRPGRRKLAVSAAVSAELKQEFEQILSTQKLPEIENI